MNGLYPQSCLSSDGSLLKHDGPLGTPSCLAPLLLVTHTVFVVIIICLVAPLTPSRTSPQRRQCLSPRALPSYCRRSRMRRNYQLPRETGLVSSLVRNERVLGRGEVGGKRGIVSRLGALACFDRDNVSSVCHVMAIPTLLGDCPRP